MNGPLEKLVREVIKMPLGLKFTLCVSTNIVLFSIGSARRASMKRNTTSVVGFIVVAVVASYSTSTTVPVITAAARKNSKSCNKQLARNLSSRTV